MQVDLLKRILLEFKPKKKLGQHFITSTRALKSFAHHVKKIAEENNSRKLVEVCAGLCQISAYLIAEEKYDCNVVCIDIDKRIIPHAKEFLNKVHVSTVDIVIGDAVKLVSCLRTKIVFGNLAFNIASQVIEKSVINNNILCCVYGIQKEVAFRLKAKPGEKDYSRLTVLVQKYFDVRIVDVIRKHEYYPRPKVDTCVVVLKRKELVHDDKIVKEFSDFLAKLFSQKNKKICKVLKHYGLDGKDVGVNLEKRVYELTVDELWKLYTMLMG